MVEEKDYLLTNQEILGGIKAAIARGEELKDAMMTFYQAGYDKKEIEDAAKTYVEMQQAKAQGLPVQQKTAPAKKPEEKKEEEKKADVKKGEVKKEEKLEDKKIVPIKEVPAGGSEKKGEKKETKQKVSNYEIPKGKIKKDPLKGKALTAVLILSLLILLGFLTAIFLFKGELVVFVNNLFG